MKTDLKNLRSLIEELLISKGVKSDQRIKHMLTWRLGLAIYFSSLAALNLFMLLAANVFALSSSNQPYDYYVLLHASSQIFSDPSIVYMHQYGVSVLGTYWEHWLWYGASYKYSPMFALLLSPLSSFYPPAVKIFWECLSYFALILSCLLVLRLVPWRMGKILLPILILIMPIPLIMVHELLPQFYISGWAWISPVYFADYYWGNTNTMILSLALLSYYFGFRDPKQAVDLKFVKVPPYILSSLFLALDTFKISAVLLILPFWIFLNRRSILKSMLSFAVLVALLNSILLFEPTLIGNYLSMLKFEISMPPNYSALWQTYEYLWYYTIPIVGSLLSFLSVQMELKIPNLLESELENPPRAT